MCNRPGWTPSARQRGVSIIELMVGIVVSLLVGLAATQSAIMFTATQRQSVGTGGIAVNTATVMSAIKDDLALAGLGFFGSSTYLCDRLNLSLDGVVRVDGASFSPLQVTRLATGDTIDAVYGTRVEAGANLLLDAVSTGLDATLRSYLPTALGQAVLLAPAAPGPLAAPCLVRTVSTNTASTATTPQQLAFSAAGANKRYNGGAFANNPGFAKSDRIAVLGDLRWTRYRVNAGNLVVERPLDGTSATLVRNVIAFRVQYGVAPATLPGSPLNTTLEQWVDPTGPFAAISGTTLPRIRAMRIGLIVRSPQIEKADASTGACAATDTKPTLFGLPAENLANADWNCYRYRSTTVVVPLRNVVMGLR
jgi:type IV pilus assembly protein PilW